MILLICTKTRKGEYRYYFCEKRWLVRAIYVVRKLTKCHLFSFVTPVMKKWVSVSAEDESTRYVTLSPIIRDVFRKGKKGWYYAGWYKV